MWKRALSMRRAEDLFRWRFQALKKLLNFGKLFPPSLSFLILLILGIPFEWVPIKHLIWFYSVLFHSIPHQKPKVKSASWASTLNLRLLNHLQIVQFLYQLNFQIVRSSPQLDFWFHWIYLSLSSSTSSTPSSTPILLSYSNWLASLPQPSSLSPTPFHSHSLHHVYPEIQQELQKPRRNRVLLEILAKGFQSWYRNWYGQQEDWIH